MASSYVVTVELFDQEDDMEVLFPRKLLSRDAMSIRKHTITDIANKVATSNESRRIIRYIRSEHDKTHASIPVRSVRPCMRIIEYNMVKMWGHRHNRPMTSLVGAHIVASCILELPYVVREREVLRMPATSTSPKKTTVMDLTTLDEWSDDVARSTDFQRLPEHLHVTFEDYIDNDNKIFCAVYLDRVVPRRYVDCCLDTGALFCYTISSLNVYVQKRVDPEDNPQAS